MGMKTTTHEQVHRMLEERFGTPIEHGDRTLRTLIEAGRRASTRHILEPGSRFNTLCTTDDQNAVPFPRSERDLEVMRGIPTPGVVDPQPAQGRYCARCIKAAMKHLGVA
jgi:hypothetical protein